MRNCYLNVMYKIALFNHAILDKKVKIEFVFFVIITIVA